MVLTTCPAEGAGEGVGVGQLLLRWGGAPWDCDVLMKVGDKANLYWARGPEGHPGCVSGTGRTSSETQELTPCGFCKHQSLYYTFARGYSCHHSRKVQATGRQRLQLVVPAGTGFAGTVRVK